MCIAPALARDLCSQFDAEAVQLALASIAPPSPPSNFLVVAIQHPSNSYPPPG